MSFFKKIGKGIKVASKQISLKNAIKIGSKFDPTGIVGMVQDRHYQKKQDKINNIPIEAIQEFSNDSLKGNPNPSVKDILLGGAGGFLTGAGTVLGGSNQAGTAGASIIDSSATQYVKKNWLKILGFVTSLVIVVLVLVRFVFKKKTSFPIKRRF